MSAGVNTRGADVSFKDVTIETPDRKCDRGMWMTSRIGSGGWDLRKVSELRLRPGRGQTNLCATDAARVGEGADGKVSIERMCISLPYVEKPFNSKVIKSFVPELRRTPGPLANTLPTKNLPTSSQKRVISFSIQVIFIVTESLYLIEILLLI